MLYHSIAWCCVFIKLNHFMCLSCISFSGKCRHFFQCSTYTSFLSHWGAVLFTYKLTTVYLSILSIHAMCDWIKPSLFSVPLKFIWTTSMKRQFCISVKISPAKFFVSLTFVLQFLLGKFTVLEISCILNWSFMNNFSGYARLEQPDWSAPFRIFPL